MSQVKYNFAKRILVYNEVELLEYLMLPWCLGGAVYIQAPPCSSCSSIYNRWKVTLCVTVCTPRRGDVLCLPRTLFQQFQWKYLNYVSRQWQSVSFLTGRIETIQQIIEQEVFSCVLNIVPLKKKKKSCCLSRHLSASVQSSVSWSWV